MKTLILLLLPMLLCTACTALPAEERAFAVALCVEKDEVWRVHGRIPTYQTGGGYMTVTGTGDTLLSALSAMDAAAPMRINLSQLRLLTADVKLAESGELPMLLTTLAERPDMRLQCQVALTDSPAQSVADALKPAAGSRLSKSLDLMLDARVEQGSILPASLADVLRMGERLSPVLTALTLEDETITLSGGYTMDGLRIAGEEVILLSLLMGQKRSMWLNLPAGAAQVRDASAKIRLSEDASAAHVALTLHPVGVTPMGSALRQSLANELLSLLSRLSAQGCDVLGLGRQAIVRTHDMTEWRSLQWEEKLRHLQWNVSVGVKDPA